MSDSESEPEYLELESKPKQKRKVTGPRMDNLKKMWEAKKAKAEERRKLKEAPVVQPQVQPQAVQQAQPIQAPQPEVKQPEPTPKAPDSIDHIMKYLMQMNNDIQSLKATRQETVPDKPLPELKKAKPKKPKAVKPKEAPKPKEQPQAPPQPVQQPKPQPFDFKRFF